MSEPVKYRYRDLKPGDAYYEAWRKFNRRDLAPFWIFLGLIPFSLLVFLGFERMGLGDDWVIVPLFVYGIGYMVSSFWSRGGRCPRCGEVFRGPVYSDTFWSFKGTCRYCSLAKWAPDDPDKASATADA